MTILKSCLPTSKKKILHYQNFAELNISPLPYSGSKIQFLDTIENLISELPGIETVFDGFSGSTAVSQYLSPKFNMICNDIAVWSKVVNNCMLKATKPEKYYLKIINELNRIKPKSGWFSQSYGGQENNGNASQSNGLQRPFQLHVTRKLDAMRKRIDEFCLPEIDKDVILTSLLQALTSVSNTFGHFVSYPKKWTNRSYYNLFLLMPKLLYPKTKIEVYQKDVMEILKNRKDFDLAYLDPPTGTSNNRTKKSKSSRTRYAGNYHFWKTVCLNDKPEFFGKANRRMDSSDPIVNCKFESIKKSSDGKRLEAGIAIEDMIQSVRCKYILFTYSSRGSVSLDEIYTFLKTHKIIRFKKINYKKNVFDKTWKKDALEYEYFFLIENGNYHNR